MLVFIERKQWPAAVRVWEMIIDNNISMLSIIVASDYCVAIGFQALGLEHGNYPHRKLWHKAIEYGCMV